MSDQAVQSFWDDHVGWSKTADRLKRRIVVARTVTFLLTIAGAALGTLAAAAPGESVRISAGIAGTVALTLVPFIARFFTTPDETGKWLRSRSVSEGMKSEIYTYLAGANPYDGPNPIASLHSKLKEISSFAKNLEVERAAAGSPSEPAPPALGASDYLTLRVQEQIDRFYKPKAKLNADRANQFRWAEIVLAGLAAILSGVATALGLPAADGGSAPIGALASWVAVLTTIGATVAAHAAASRYEFQATTYYATARQLQDLAKEWQAAGASAPSPEWSALVRNCEEAISAENRAWMAKQLDQNA